MLYCVIAAGSPTKFNYFSSTFGTSDGFTFNSISSFLLSHPRNFVIYLQTTNKSFFLFVFKNLIYIFFEKKQLIGFVDIDISNSFIYFFFFFYLETCSHRIWSRLAPLRLVTKQNRKYFDSIEIRAGPGGYASIEIVQNYKRLLSFYHVKKKKTETKQKTLPQKYDFSTCCARQEKRNVRRMRKLSMKTASESVLSFVIDQGRIWADNRLAPLHKSVPQRQKVVWSVLLSSSRPHPILLGTWKAFSAGAHPRTSPVIPQWWEKERKKIVNIMLME